MKMIKYILPLLFIFCYNSVTAQFNVAVGYNLSYTSAPIYNTIIDNYNAREVDKRANLQNFHFLNGVVMGARYRVGFAGLDFLWTENFGRGRAEAGDTVDGPFLEGLYTYRAVNYRYRSFGLGYTTYINDTWSFGGSFNRDLFRINTETNRNIEKDISRGTSYSSRFFIGISTEANAQLNISLQPFVWVPWGEFDFQEFNNLINTDAPLENTKDSFLQFGVSIIFYNGKQY